MSQPNDCAITINPRVQPRPPQPGELAAERLTFGRKFSPHMFLAKYTEGRSWHDAQIIPYGKIELDPAALVLHYGQETFEGLKAYARADGEIGLFRPEQNAHRLNHSNERLCIPTIPEAFFLEAIETLVDIERDWVPTVEGSSLYLRPTVIATEVGLGVRVSREYLFYVFAGPVGPYFGSFAPVAITTPEKYSRAAAGGIGEAKTGGNYAASLLPIRDAAEQGYKQVLFLDARERRFIEELGGMNVFVVRGNTLVTPPLTGTILAGVTRDSLFTLGHDLGLVVEEQQIDIEELVAAIDQGEVTEMFAAGTAAVTTPIGVLAHRGQNHPIGDGKAGKVTQRIYQALTDIQYGRTPDSHGWTRTVARRFVTAS